MQLTNIAAGTAVAWQLPNLLKNLVAARIGQGSGDEVKLAIRVASYFSVAAI